MPAGPAGSLARAGPAGFWRALARADKLRAARPRAALSSHVAPCKARREDAAAALDLYLSHVHFAAESMDYEDLVEHFAAQILGGGVDGDADGNSRGDSSSGGEEEGSSWAQEWGSMEE